MTNKPWLPYLAIEHIKQLKPKTVFEWGSGESTLFFLNTIGVTRLVSVEHDIDWYYKTAKQLPDEQLDDYLFIPYEEGIIGQDKANPAHYKSGSTLLGDVNFKKYASVIDECKKFDLILIDGMARASCLQHAFSHVNPSGCIVLDNTNDRSYYLEQTIHLFGNYESGWERIDFFGYGPTLDYKWQTTFFINKMKQDYVGPDKQTR